jgi:hypothetical protein
MYALACVQRQLHLHERSALSTKAPAAMIFTVCRLGISQSEAEHSELAGLVPGCLVLLHAALAGTYIL